MIRKSTKRVLVADGNVNHGEHEVELPFEGLSTQAKTGDTFDRFRESLMSVGKVNDDGNVSIFTKDDVTVYKEEDVLITCKGKPILIGIRDERGRYRIPLDQRRKGRWRPRIPTQAESIKLAQANSVYDLPSTEQAIKWMHAVCGYPVKSTWVKAVQAGNFVGWPMLNVRNVKKYYPETSETPKGHMAQTRKNVRSTKSKPFEECNTEKLFKRKKRDVYIKIYDVEEFRTTRLPKEIRNTIYSDQTGQFLKVSLRKNKYIMVMVEIDSNAILVEPMKSRKDGEMKRAYEHLLLRLKRAGAQPKKHALDNKVSESMKTAWLGDH